MKETISKLQLAINRHGDYTVLYNCNQFYSKEKRKPINMYSIKMLKYNPEEDKSKYEEVFKAGKQILVVLFLRNLWFTINEKEIPQSEFPKFEIQWRAFVKEHLNK